MHGLDVIHRINLEEEKRILKKHGLTSPRVQAAKVEKRKTQLETMKKILQNGGYA